MSDDENRKELITKLKALSMRKFGTDDAWPKVFSAYDADGDGHLMHSEVVAMFGDADIGNGFTRSAWAERVMASIDADGLVDSITREELEEALRKMAPPPKIKPLTPEDARVIGRLIATRPGTITFDDSLSKDDIALIEEMTAQEHARAYGAKTTTTPPIPPRDAAPRASAPSSSAPSSSASVAQQIVIGVLVGWLTLRLATRLR